MTSKAFLIHPPGHLIIVMAQSHAAQETVSHNDIHDYPLIPWKEVMCPEHETTRSRLHPSSCQLSPAGCWGRHWGGKSSLWFPRLAPPHPYLREVASPHAGTCHVGKPHERVLLSQARKRSSGSLLQCSAGLHHRVKHPSLLRQAGSIWSWGCCVFSIPWHLSL